MFKSILLPILILELILKLLKKLKVPAQIVLNQANLGPKQLIKKISQKSKVDIKYQIPYSQKLAQAYSQGKLKNLNLL